MHDCTCAAGVLCSVTIDIVIDIDVPRTSAHHVCMTWPLYSQMGVCVFLMAEHNIMLRSAIILHNRTCTCAIVIVGLYTRCIIGIGRRCYLH